MKKILFALTLVSFIFASCDSIAQQPDCKKEIDSLNKKIGELEYKIEQLENNKNQVEVHREGDLAKNEDNSSQNNGNSSNLNNKKNNLFADTNQTFLRYKNQMFEYYIVDLKKDDLTFYYQDTKKQKYTDFAGVKARGLAKDKELAFITNGGMFEPDGSPVGLYVENRKTINPMDNKNGSGNFYMKPNGIFIIDTLGKAKVVESKEYNNLKANIKSATQSGPMLVINNKIHHMLNDGSTNKQFRSGVGTISEDKVVFVISNEAVNFYDFASVFRDYFGCENALYLDGAISKMYLPHNGRHEEKGFFGVMIGVEKNKK